MTAEYVSKDGLVAEWEHSTFESGGSKWTDGVNGHVITFVGNVPSTSERGIEFAEGTTFSSDSLESHGLSSDAGVTFEYIGWIDRESFRSSANHPGCVFGVSPVSGFWSGIMAYAYDNSVSNASGARGLTLEVAGVAGQDLKLATQLSSEKMYHIVVTVEKNTIKAFIDSADTVKSGTMSDSVTKGWPVDFKYIYNSEGAGRSKGSIHTMRIWSRTLNNDEVTDLFSVDLTTKTPLYFKKNGKWAHASRVMSKSNGVWKTISYKDFAVMSKLQHMGFVPRDITEAIKDS